MAGEHGWRSGPKSDALLDRADVRRDLELAESLGLTLGQFDRLPDSERSLWVARWRREQEKCPDCGRPIADCSDPERKRKVFRQVCYATMDRLAAQAMYEKLHEAAPFHDGSFTEWSKVRSARHPYHFNDGVTVGVADEDFAPWDKFTTEANASPVPHEPQVANPQDPI